MENLLGVAKSYLEENGIDTSMMNEEEIIDKYYSMLTEELSELEEEVSTIEEEISDVEEEISDVEDAINEEAEPEIETEEQPEAEEVKETEDIQAIEEVQDENDEETDEVEETSNDIIQKLDILLSNNEEVIKSLDENQKILYNALIKLIVEG